MRKSKKYICSATNVITIMLTDQSNSRTYVETHQRYVPAPVILLQMHYIIEHIGDSESIEESQYSKDNSRKGRIGISQLGWIAVWIKAKVMYFISPQL